MCGRYTLTVSSAELAAYFELDPATPALKPRYNIAPSQNIAIIRDVPGSGPRLDLVRWGLIPSWAKDPKIGQRLINARAETIGTKPSFRAAYRRRRCLIPADGFYEWKSIDRHKQPYWIGLEHRRLFAFAGLWEHWQDSDQGQQVESCTIITRPANREIAEIHQRMPVMLDRSDHKHWLEPGTPPAALASLLSATGPGPLLIYAVTREVNYPANDHPGLLNPVRQ